MNNQRIKLTDNVTNIVAKMSDGNPGAMNAMMQIISYGEKQPNPYVGLHWILMLDSLGIYGTDIYVLFSDICQRDVSKMGAVIEAVQLGLFDGGTLKDATSRQDYSGRDIIPVDELCAKVKEFESQSKQ